MKERTKNNEKIKCLFGKDTENGCCCLPKSDIRDEYRFSNSRCRFNGEGESNTIILKCIIKKNNENNYLIKTEKKGQRTGRGVGEKRKVVHRKNCQFTFVPTIRWDSK